MRAWQLHRVIRTSMLDGFDMMLLTHHNHKPRPLSAGKRR
jgi:hypothetical protein